MLPDEGSCEQASWVIASRDAHQQKSQDGGDRLINRAHVRPQAGSFRWSLLVQGISQVPGAASQLYNQNVTHIGCVCCTGLRLQGTTSWL